MPKESVQSVSLFWHVLNRKDASLLRGWVEIGPKNWLAPFVIFTTNGNGNFYKSPSHSLTERRKGDEHRLS